MAEIRHVQVKIDEDLAAWFDENCVTFSKQHFIEQCFVMLRAAVTLGKLPHPNFYAAFAAVDSLKTLTNTEATDGGSEPVRPETSAP